MSALPYLTYGNSDDKPQEVQVPNMSLRSVVPTTLLLMAFGYKNHEYMVSGSPASACIKGTNYNAFENTRGKLSCGAVPGLSPTAPSPRTCGG